MKLESLADQAFTMYTLGSGEDSASDSVKAAIAGASLNPEEIHRVCTLVNRKIHGMEKKSHGSGGLWRSRWTTAKAEDITGNTDSPYSRWDSTTERVASARNKKATEKLSEKRSEKRAPTVSILELTPKYASAEEVDDTDIEEMFDIPAPEAETSSPEDLDNLQATLLESVQAQEEAVAAGEAEMLRLELESVQAAAALDEELNTVTKALGLRLGELMLVGEVTSIPTEYLARAMDNYLREHSLSPDALDGSLRDENGDLMEADILDASEHLEVRDVLREFLQGPMAAEDPHIARLVSAVERLEGVAEEMASVSAAVANLKEDLKSMEEV